MSRKVTVALAAALTLGLPAPAHGAAPTPATPRADLSAPGAHASGYVDTTVSAAGRSFSTASRACVDLCREG